jgi:glucose-1-phosphate cytidylyltransferase
MVEVGGLPILWHIMKTYSYYGYNDFVICLGYKGYMIKEWFANYFLHKSDVTINLKTNKMDVHSTKSEDWVVTLVDTGDKTQTGGRIRRIEKYTEGKPFMLTYGDGVSDINFKDLAAFHKKSGKAATVTAVQPPGRFGALDIKDNLVSKFLEKPKGDGAWINGGFFMLEPDIFDYIKGDHTSWELHSLAKLASENKLAAFKHTGFWKPMDKLRDKTELDELWNAGKAPWKVWRD